jgi:hypothetical protein
MLEHARQQWQATSLVHRKGHALQALWDPMGVKVFSCFLFSVSSECFSSLPCYFHLSTCGIQADMQVGDSCELGMPTPPTKGGPVEIPRAWRPDCDPPPETDATCWTVRMLPGPQADPDYFTPDDMKVLCSSGGHSRIDRWWLADQALLALPEL